MRSPESPTGRLQELADICERRKLTREELDEVFDLSVGAETVEEAEAWLREQGDE